jgi:arginase
VGGPVTGIAVVGLLCRTSDRTAGGARGAELDLAGVPRVERPSQVADAVDGANVYVHLDLDVLDPELMPARYPSDGGLSQEKLYDLLDAVAEACEVVGLEITCLEDPERAGLVADTVAPLLDAARADGQSGE